MGPAKIPDPYPAATKRSAKRSDHLAKIREAERLVDAVEKAREQLRATARSAMGITGERGPSEPLRKSIKSSNLSWYPLLALSVLVIIDQFQGYALFVLGPEISSSLGISRGALGGLAALKVLAISVATLPMAAFVQKKARRAVVSIVTAFAWSTTTIFTGFVINVWGMLTVMLADGASSGSVAAVHAPLLIDSYPPRVRVRALSFYRSAENLGNILAPVLLGGLSALFGFTWRAIFLIMGIASLLAANFALRLKDPGFGRWDTQAVREAVHREGGLSETNLSDEEVDLGFFEIVRRLMLIPTIRRILTAHAVLGMLLVPLNTYLFFFLDERWGMGPGARGLFYGAMPIFSISALALFAKKGEEIFRRNPAGLLRLAALFLGAGVIALALAIFSPVFAAMVLLFGVAFALIALLGPALNAAMLSIIPSRMRPHAAALTGIFLAGVGGFGGLLLLGGLDRRFGTAGAIVSLVVPGVAAAFVLRTAARTINADLDRMVDEIVEEEELRSLVGQGHHLPMLACRHIDFSYGQLQVLFSVDFTVDDGEMVALLGTNGAGKSTLLRVISGLGLPGSGSVRFRGADITYLDSGRRVKLGITQVPGGRSVFGPLSVIENLRLFGYSHGRDTKTLDRAIEECFGVFPVLAGRLNQPASTLSGGEQQMLGLSKAFILRPRLLLIDELSLGLAPKIVGELLDMVRQINATGTAVVLVEQSVNLALSLVEHAYFMEKGEIRFDGRADELVERADLLRSVFLEGAAKGLASR